MTSTVSFGVGEEPGQHRLAQHVDALGQVVLVDLVEDAELGPSLEAACFARRGSRGRRRRRRPGCQAVADVLGADDQ
jgi:hypothetical protein